jgi:hypothetical protein
MIFSFFPAQVGVGVWGPEETKNPAGKSPPPDSDPANQVELKCLLVYGTLVPHASGFDLISDALPFGYDTPDNAIGYAMHSSRSHDAVIRVYDAAGNVIKTHKR